MEEDFEDFMNERIEHNLHKLIKTKKWQKDKKEFQINYNELYKQLSTKQKKLFDNIIETQNSLWYFESRFTYKLAFTDIRSLFKIKNV